MNYQLFKKTFGLYPVITSQTLKTHGLDPDYTKRQLSERTSLSKLIRLKRWVYMLPDATTHPYTIANHLYRPSYVSCESALQYRWVIPESVHVITSVSTKKTATYTSSYGSYTYHHMTAKLYGGYEARETFLIACQEKALVDRLWYHSPSQPTLATIRATLPSSFDTDKAREFALQSNNKTFIAARDTFIATQANENTFF